MDVLRKRTSQRLPSSPGLDGGTTERPRTSIEAWALFVAQPSHLGEVGKAGPSLREVHPLFLAWNLSGGSKRVVVLQKRTGIFELFGIRWYNIATPNFDRCLGSLCCTTVSSWRAWRI